MHAGLAFVNQSVAVGITVTLVMCRG